MKTLSELARMVREDKADQILGVINESPAILTQKDDAGVPLGHLFALKKQLQLVESVLSQAALETVWDLPGWTLAHTAAAVGDAFALKRILQQNQHVFYWNDRQGRSPIHIAAQHAHLDQFDVEAAHLTARDHLFNTPLHAAAISSGLPPVAEKLTPEMLLLINLQAETVLELINQTPPIPASLKNVVWEAEFLSDPKKRTVQNVLEHHGIKL